MDRSQCSISRPPFRRKQLLYVQLLYVQPSYFRFHILSSYFLLNIEIPLDKYIGYKIGTKISYLKKERQIRE